MVIKKGYLYLIFILEQLELEQTFTNSCRFRPAVRGPYCSSGPTRKYFFLFVIMLWAGRFAAALGNGESGPIYVSANRKDAYVSPKKTKREPGTP